TVVLAGGDGRMPEIAGEGHVLIGNPAHQPDPIERLQRQITVARYPLEVLARGSGIKSICEQSVRRRHHYSRRVCERHLSIEGSPLVTTARAEGETLPLEELIQ